MAVAACVIVCPIAAYELYQHNAARALDLLEQALGDTPDADSNVIQFQPRQKTKADDCPPDDGCEKAQKVLLSRRSMLTNMLNARLLTIQDYVQRARLFNEDVRLHNRRCPHYPVRPLPIGPRGL